MLHNTLALCMALTSLGPDSSEVTVYNQGFGFVKEVRSFDLRTGRQTVKVEDVASLIEPTSVGIRSLGNLDAFSVLEQIYQYDLISPLAILNKSVGKRVRLIRSIADKREVLEGVLLSAPVAMVNAGAGSGPTYNGMVLRTDDGRIVLDRFGVHRPNDENVVREPRRVRQEFAPPHARLTLLRKLVS